MRAALALVAAFGLVAAAPVERIGAATAIGGTVRATTAPDAPRALTVGGAVHTADLIATAALGSARLRLVDGTMVGLGPEADLRLDSFVYDRDVPASRVSVALLKGAMRFISGTPTHAFPGQTAITTPAATIGIRGTVVDIVVGPSAIAFAGRARGIATTGDPATATLIVLRGRRSVKTGIDVTANGTTVALRRPGQAVFAARAGAALDLPFVLDSALLRSVGSLAAPEMRRDARGGGTGSRLGDDRDRRPRDMDAPPQQQSPQLPSPPPPRDR